MPGPLEGIRVVEVANWVAGPATCAILAELGAEVIKVEHPETGDPMRSVTTTPLGVMPYTSGVNVAVEEDNRGKKSIAVNLEHPEGQEILHKLTAHADVFVTNLIPRRQERYRLRYEDLSALNPRLIYVSLTGYGQEGPEKDRPGFDYAAFWARSGIMGTIGEPQWTPVNQRPGMGDHTTALAMAAAVGFALFERERSGKGQRVDCALLHTGLWVLGMDVVAAFYHKCAVRKMARTEVTNPLFNYYQAADGKWIQLVMIESDRFWPNFCRAMRLEHLRHDPRFATHAARRQNCRDLIRILDERFATLPRHEWAQRLDAEGCIWAPVQTLDEVINDPQVHANGYVATLRHTSGEEFQVVRAPMKFRRTPGTIPGPAPDLGQHTEDVLHALGYTWDDILRLKERGTIR
ncbi:MAG: CoA transferase [Dehalococcoidia bacterium]|nr:CoA transferase [Dehalococcoidia bacterium]MDW8119803.1 CoA transferase [Chloroflexota bacterium]